MTTVLKTKNDRFYAVINYKEGKTYKQKWISLGLPVKNNKRKAEALLDEVKKKYVEGYETPSGDILFTSFIKQWLSQKKGLIEQSTWEGYQIYALRHIIPFFEPLNLKLRDVKPYHIQNYYQYKFSSGRLDGKSGGLSIPSIRKHSIVIREVLDEAVIKEFIIRNPAETVKLPTKSYVERERAFLNADEANNLLKVFDGHPLQALIYTTLYYGLRRSEVLGLRWQAIDFDKGTLTINHTIVKNCTIIEKDTTKTAASFHTYLLIEDVRNVLLSERNKQMSNGIKTDYVFARSDGSPLRPDYVTKTFQKVLKMNSLPMMRFHDLRHSTASILYDKGWDIKDIQSWLRHSSIDVTSDIYTHITEDRKAKMAENLNSTFTI